MKWLAPARVFRLLSQPRWTMAAGLGAIIFGVGASLYVAQYVAASHEKLIQQRFQDDTTQYGEAVDQRLKDYAAFLTGLRAFFYGSDRVERHEFKNFVELVLQKHFLEKSGIQAIEWIPRVRQAGREAHERAARAEGFTNYRITEQDANRNPVPAGVREEYFPVHYIEPMRSNEKALGFDLGSNPARRSAMEKAAESGSPVCSDRLVLIQERESLPGFLIFCPCYDQRVKDLKTEAERREHLLGYVLLVLRAGDFLSSAFQDKHLPQAEAYLYDPASPAGQQLLAACAGTGQHMGLQPLRNAAGATADYLSVSQGVKAPGKSWTLTIMAERGFYEAGNWNPATTVGLLGISLTSLATLLGRALVRVFLQQEKIRQMNAELEQRVADRTAEAMDLYENAPCGYHALGPDGLVLRMNATELSWLGYQRAEVEGRLNMLDLIAPAARGLFRERFAQNQKTGSVSDVEMPLRRKDGTVLMALINAKAVYDGAGKFLQGRASVVNITQRKVAENKAHELAERLGLATRASGVGIWDYDLVKNRLVWDEQMYHLYGLAGPQRVDAYETWLAGVYVDDRAQCHEEAQMALRGECDFDTHFRVEWPDGSVHNIRAQGIVERDSQGKPIRFLGTNWDITPHKTLEDALRLSEAKQRAIFNASPDAILSVSEQGLIQDNNPAALTLFGYAPDETLVGLPLTQLCPATQPDGRDSLEMIKEVIARVSAEGNIFITWQHRRRDGTDFPSEVSICLVEQAGEKFYHGILRDVSSRERAQADLKASEKRFRRLFEMAPIPLSLRNAQGETIRLNQSFTRTFGYRLEDLPTNEVRWEKFFPNENYRHQIQSRWKEALTGTRDGKMDQELIECRVTCLDGAVRVVLLSGVDLGEEFLNSYHDITALTQADAQLRKLSQAVKYSPSMVLITDAQGRIEYANPAWELTTGYRLTEVQGQGVNLLKSGLHDPEYYRQIWKEIKAGKIWYGEFCNRNRDGTDYWISSSIAPVYNDAGEITHFIAVEEDVTQRKETEAQLRTAKEAAEAANRAKSVFLANMSHEIRTPMNAILGFAQLLLRDPVLGPPQQQHLTSIRQSGAHLLALINDLLEMARLESGRITMRATDFDLRWLLEEAGRMFRQRAQEKGLNFELRLAEGLPRWVRGDATKLRQVLLNLFGNALKFTAHGVISLSASSSAKPDGTIQVSAEVQDTGCGIKEEDRPYVFRPFFQTAVGKEIKGSTGLGLAISRELCRLMGGDLTFETEPGKGSTFRLEMLAKASVGPAAGATEEVQERPLHLQQAWEGLEVLVVDDEPANRELLAQLLTSIGFAVRMAGDGAAALAQYAERRPPLILMDIRMPVMDGHTAIRELREKHGAAGVILALSASVFAEDRERALAAGANDFLAKPFDTDELLGLIKRHLGIDYLYTQPAAAPPAGAKAAPSRDAIRQLPAEWAREFQAAIKRVDYDRLVALTEQAAGTDANLAGQLRQLVEHFDYPTLEALLNEA